LVEEQSVDVDINIPSAKSPNRDAVAVVIGNCNYSAEHRDVPDVEFAARDAAVMKEYLLKALGYQEGNILYYTDAGLATFRDVFGTKEEPRGRLANSVKAGKSDVFVYYSGHGAPDVSEKKGYFVPVDCDPNAVSRNGYPLELLYENLGKMGARSVTVVVDACFSGGTSEGKMLIAQASPGAIRIIDPTANWGEGALFTAAAGDQIASWFAEKKHGLFTYAFLKGLQGAADADGDGTITAGELHEFINNGSGDFEGVTYLARRLFNGREQTPGFSGDARRIIR
jgi:hypothetical protein